MAQLDDLVATYRINAANCIDIAQTVSDAKARLVLLTMARSWLALAEQAIKNSDTVLIYETPDEKESI